MGFFGGSFAAYSYIRDTVKNFFCGAVLIDSDFLAKNSSYGNDILAYNGLNDFAEGLKMTVKLRLYSPANLSENELETLQAAIAGTNYELKQFSREGDRYYIDVEASTFDVTPDTTVSNDTTIGNITVSAGSTVTVTESASVPETSVTAKTITITNGEAEPTTAYVVSDGTNTGVITSIRKDASVTADGKDAVSDFVDVADVLAGAVAENTTLDPSTITSVVLSLSKTEPTEQQLSNINVPEDAVAVEVHPVATVTTTVGSESTTSTYDVKNSDLAENARFTFSLDLGESFKNRTVKLTHYPESGTPEVLGNFVADESGRVSGVTLSSFSVILANEVTYVAQVGNDMYETLEAAIAAISTKTESTHSNSTADNKVYTTYVANGQIKLLDDCEGDGIILGEHSSLQIDFNGKTYSVTGRPVGSNGTETIGFQLLKDSTITFMNGAIDGDSDDLVRLIQNYSDLTLIDMTLSMKGQYYDQSTMSLCNGMVNVQGSTINAPDYTWIDESYSNPAQFGASAFTVGTFSTYPSVTVTVTTSADHPSGSVINGNVVVDPSGTGAASTVLRLNSGTLNGDIVMNDDEGSEARKATVSKASSFSTNTPEGYIWTTTGNTKTLVPDYAAQIGNTGYMTLAEAFAAAQGGQTITVLRDSTEEEEVVFDHTGASVTLDLAGHTVGVKKDMWVKNGSLTLTSTAEGGKVQDLQNDAAIYVSSNKNSASATLTIASDNVTVEGGQWGIAFMSNATVNIAAGTVMTTGTNGEGFAVSGNGNSTGAELNISGGKITGTVLGVYFPGSNTLNITGGEITGATGIYQKSGTMSIGGLAKIYGTGAKAEFTHNGNGANATGDAIVVESCGYPSGAPTATITGNPTISSEYGVMIADHVWTAEGQGTTNPDPTITANSTTITLPAGEMWVPGTRAGEFVIGKAVAEVDGTPYATFAEAVAAAHASTAETVTITLLADVNLTATQVITKSMTINLNGHNITAQNCRALWIKSGNVDITAPKETAGEGKNIVSVTHDVNDTTFASNSSVIRVGDSDANSTPADVLIGTYVTVSTDYCYGISVFGRNTESVPNGKPINLWVTGTVAVTGEAAAISGNGSAGLSETSIIIEGTVSSEKDYAIYHPGSGELSVHSGSNVRGLGGIEAKGGSVTINDGASVTATAKEQTHSAYNNGASTSGYAIAAVSNTNYAGDPTVTINGGTISGKAIILADFNAPNNGTVTAKSSTIATDPGYKWVETETAGTYKLVEIEYVAQIGETNKYETLEAAVAAAQSGDTVKLIADIGLTAAQVISKNMTIDLNGHKITANGDRALWVKSGDVTITGSGEVSATGNVNASSSVIRVGDSAANTNKAKLIIGEDVTVSSDKCYGVTVFGVNDTDNDKTTSDIELVLNGKVNVTGTASAVSGNGTNTLSATTITINGEVTAANDYAIYHPGKGTLTVSGTVSGLGGIEAKGGKVTINDGASVTATAQEQTHTAYNNGASTSGYAIAAVSNTNYAGEPDVTINGGTITGKAIILADFDAQNNGTVTAKSSTIATDSDYKWVETETAGTYKLVEKTYVAQIGEAKYETLEAAFADAVDGNTIKLLADVSLTDRLFVNAGAEPAYAGSNNRYATTSENKSITLDLNGYDITSSSNIALAGGSLNITGNGTISTTGSGLAPIEIRGTGELASKRSLTIGQSVTLTGVDYGLNIFGSNDAQKNLIDVTVNGTINGTLFVLGNLTNAENAINIVVNGTVTAVSGAGEDPNVGIALNGNANVTVNSTASVSGDSGIEVRAGNLTVNGGTIEATAATYSYKPNGSGCTTKGAAIAVAQHGTKLPITATLNGGTLTGIEKIGVTNVNNDMSDVNVTATKSFTESSAIPEGYAWKATTSGDYTLVPAVTVTFNANGGTPVPAAQQIAVGGKVTEPTDPTKDGFNFGGWYKDAEFEEAWNFEIDTVTSAITLYAKWTTGATAKYSATLTLNNNIDVNFYVYNLSDAAHPERYTVETTFNGETKTTNLGEAETIGSQGTTLYHVIAASCRAEQMGDTVDIVVKYDNSQIFKYEGYSVEKYCENQIETSTDNTLLDLCKSTLEYGEYAQKHFNYKTNNLVTKKYSANKVVPGASPVPESYNIATATGDSGTFRNVSATLTLASELETNFYFQPVSGRNYTFTVTKGGRTIENPEILDYSGWIWVKVSNFGATELSDAVVVTGTDGTHTRTLTYSPMSYAYRMQTNAQAGNISQALYYYYTAAVAFFNAHQ